jgi:hypothetical protein
MSKRGEDGVADKACHPASPPAAQGALADESCDTTRGRRQEAGGRRQDAVGWHAQEAGRSG